MCNRRAHNNRLVSNSRLASKEQACVACVGCNVCAWVQEVLPELYCGHDAFLFSSRYEAWGMPVLEAMAAGLAVVATACLGVDTFARHGMNALLAPPEVHKRPPSPRSPLLPICQYVRGHITKDSAHADSHDNTLCNIQGIVSWLT